jgi:hypothetical protein
LFPRLPGPQGLPSRYEHDREDHGDDPREHRYPEAPFPDDVVDVARCDAMSGGFRFNLRWQHGCVCRIPGAAMASDSKVELYVAIRRGVRGVVSLR